MMHPVPDSEELLVDLSFGSPEKQQGSVLMDLCLADETDVTKEQAKLMDEIASRGEIYDGAWQNGKQHGKGTYTFANGDCYSGDFVQGKQHGHGTYIFCTGQYYKGEWQNDLMHGQGKMFANGTVTEGVWDNGKYVTPMAEFQHVMSPAVADRKTITNTTSSMRGFGNSTASNTTESRPALKRPAKKTLLRKLSSGIKTPKFSTTPRQPQPRQLAATKFLEQMDRTQVDEEDEESKELQHLWNLLLRGLEVKVPFTGKENGKENGKDNSERGKNTSSTLKIFYLDGQTLYLRKEKVLFSEKKSSMSVAALKRGTISIPLCDLRDVCFGGVNKARLSDAEADEENLAPALNKYVKLVTDSKTMELEVTERAAELLVGKFQLVIKAIDMFEKIEGALQKAQQNEVPLHVR
jgi:hypothetical protein